MSHAQLIEIVGVGMNGVASHVVGGGVLNAADNCGGGTSAWSLLAYLIEYDMLPEAVQLTAQAQIRLTTITLRPTDSPVVDYSSMDTTQPPELQQVSARIHEQEDGLAVGEGHETRNRDEKAPLAAMASALREAHGRSSDDLIDVSALARSLGIRPNGSAPPASPFTLASDGLNCSLLVGDDLLHFFPRIHGLLRQRGVKLLETSVELPHIILDHESGVLILDEKTLHKAGAAAAMAARCEGAYRSLWLLVLAEAHDGIWPLIRSLLAELYASPLKLTMRICKSADCWSILERIISQRSPDPMAGALEGTKGSASTVQGACASAFDEDDVERHETEHEAFLAMAGLNPCAAWLIMRHYSLRDFLTLPQNLRLDHFRWIPERALHCLASVADGDDDNEAYEGIEPEDAQSTLTNHVARAAHNGYPGAGPHGDEAHEEQTQDSDERMATNSSSMNDLNLRHTEQGPVDYDHLRQWQRLQSRDGDTSGGLSISSHSIGSDGQRQLCWAQACCCPAPQLSSSEPQPTYTTFRSGFAAGEDWPQRAEPGGITRGNAGSRAQGEAEGAAQTLRREQRGRGHARMARGARGKGRSSSSSNYSRAGRGRGRGVGGRAGGESK